MSGIIKILTTIVVFIITFLKSCCCPCIEPDCIKGNIENVASTINDITDDAK